MRYKVSILLLSFFVVSSCSSFNDDPYARKDVTRSVKGKELKVDFLAGYRIVGAYSDNVFLQEYRDTSRLVVYRMSGDSLIFVNGLIDKGRGPYEILYPEFSIDSDTLFVSNSDPSSIHSIYGIPLGDIESIGNPHIWTEYALPDQSMKTGLSFVKLKDGLFLLSAGHMDSNEVLSLFDVERNRVDTLSFWPDDPTPGPVFARQMMYMQCQLFHRGDKIVYGSNNGRYIFISEVKDQRLVHTHTIYSHLPQYDIIDNGNFRMNGKGEYGVAIYATEHRIYAMLMRTHQEVKDCKLYKGFPWYYHDELEVYDWNGKFIDNYRTDCPFCSFCVTSDDKYLITLTSEVETGEPRIVRYEL